MAALGGSAWAIYRARLKYDLPADENKIDDKRLYADPARKRYVANGYGLQAYNGPGVSEALKVADGLVPVGTEVAILAEIPTPTPGAPKGWAKVDVNHGDFTSFLPLHYLTATEPTAATKVYAHEAGITG